MASFQAKPATSPNPAITYVAVRSRNSFRNNSPFCLIPLRIFAPFWPNFDNDGFDICMHFYVIFFLSFCLIFLYLLYKNRLMSSLLLFYEHHSLFLQRFHSVSIKFNIHKVSTYTSISSSQGFSVRSPIVRGLCS